MSPMDRASKLVAAMRKEELRTAQWLLKDFQAFPARFGRRVEVEISEDEFSIIEDALESHVWRLMEKHGYTNDQIGRFIHGRASWDQHMKELKAEAQKKQPRTPPKSEKERKPR